MDLEELKWLDYMVLVREYWDQITEIKERLANDEDSLAALTFSELPENVRIGLWRATTKGGVWTIQERARLRAVATNEAREQ